MTSSATIFEKAGIGVTVGLPPVDADTDDTGERIATAPATWIDSTGEQA